MFDVSKVKTGLSGLIGFKQPFNPEYAVVDAQNQLSDSGYFINDNHFAKIELIMDCQDYKDISAEQFNVVLRDIISNATLNVINQVFNETTFIDRQLLYKYALNKNGTDTLPNGFIGFRIRIDDTKSVAFKITRLLCDFSGTGEVTFLLFNSSRLTAVKTQTVNITSDHQEVVLNWELNDTETLYKGEYFLGYIKGDGFALSPYKRDYENSHIMSYVTHLDIDKIAVNNHTTNTLFDISKVSYLNEATGFNPDISVYNDYTDLIIQNKFLFARAIYLSAVINTLQLYMSSIRSNYNEREADQLYNKILLEIEGTTNRDNVISVKGLRPQMLSEISDIKDEITKLRENYLGTGWELITEL